VAASTTSQFAVRNHHLSKSQFAALCAGLGDRAAVRELWRTQRSRRLLLVNALVEIANAQPQLLGPLPPAAAAWDVLVKAEEVAPAPVAATLLHPQVGSWAAYALRRHRGGARSAAPLWVDFGDLHAVALVAATRASLSWRTRLPVRDGHVMLPGLGMANFSTATRWTQVEAATGGGQIVLRHGGHEVVVPRPATGDAAGWWGLRRLSAGDQPELSVWLDDLDPFRDLADPVEPDRLDDQGFARWQQVLAEAWALLCRNHRETADAIAEGVVSLVPLPAGDGWETRSASTGEAFGSVMVSPPSDSVTLAVSLVHEFQHIKLGGLMHLGSLTHDDERQRYYAPWRDDPRPLGGLVQGVYAFMGIAGFWRDHRAATAGSEASERRLADFEYAYTRAQTHEALRTVSASGGLTGWGEQLVEGLSGRLRSWLSEPLPPESSRAAGLAVDSHRAGWRIRHVQPAPADVDALARAWSSGQTVHIRQYEPSVVPHPQRRWSLGMLTLVRRRIAAPGARLTDRLRSLNLTEADVALVDGDLSSAREGYRDRVLRNPDDLDAWVGLGLAIDGSPRAALLERPELVRAGYLKIAETGRAPDPVALAAWIGRLSAGSPKP
jgi:HEXXH motif-containing protein